MLTDTTEAMQGQQLSWNLIKKLGEGDAGEVYLVESLLDHKPAILKRPRKGAFFSDILRQAGQIKTEGSILKNLQRAPLAKLDLHLTVPTLIDQNKPEFGNGEKTFIVIEQAMGLNLKSLSQVIQFGPASIPTLPSNPETSYLVRAWSQYTEFPPQLLVRILLSVLNMLETIHSTGIRGEQRAQAGVIWNDVKPEHLYWDALGMRLTVIDWGNSQFLESDAITQDRQYSAMDDFRQFLHEMGGYLSEANAELYSNLDWPESSANSDLSAAAILALKEKLATLQAVYTEQLQQLRRQEADLYDIVHPELKHINDYEILQRQLAAHGELPDKLGGINFLFKAAYQMAVDQRLNEFQEVCENAARLPTASPDKWKLLSEIAKVAMISEESDDRRRNAFSNALADGVAEDWTAALWELFNYLGDQPRPDWWEKISQEARKICLGLEPEAIAPYTMFARLYYTLRSEISKKGEQRLHSGAEAKVNPTNENGFHWQTSEELMATVQEEIIKKWKEVEPNPPNSGIGYTEVDSLIDPIEGLLPGTRGMVDKAMQQLKTQVDLVLNAWEQKDFELARRGVRVILVWDPDRARLITAERAIDSAPQWLAKVHKGAGKDEPFYDYLTSVELAGRTLRNQVGPATWLDDTLEAFKRLRKGTRYVDLLMEYPDILHELPWLNEYESREILTLPHTHPINLEREIKPNIPVNTITGIVEGKFGPGQAMTLGEPLDTWLPEARGSSARVFAGTINDQANHLRSYALKIIRSDQLDYALPLFIEEVQILNMMRDVPGITPMVECGFIKFDDGQILPTEEKHISAEQLTGQVVHYGVEQAQIFMASMDRQLSAGWIPYLALVRRNSEYNLLRYCDTSFTHGWFLSLRDSLVLGLQICDILQIAHDRNIVYRDHKILHYYWDPDTQGVAVIDWNIAKRHPQGLSDEEKQFDLVQFGARGLHHIFTGRPAQGSLALGPNRPEDIEKASMHYPVNWTYDDEHLPNQIRAILESALNQGYTQVRDLRQDLLNIYQQITGTIKN
jgi:serine/threonine protein kinase